ncbi:uncharacterized protein LOC135237729 isoform X4 [Anguilla rostrata]|uniref:uncharacterized protein LOC135237729 isoform X4 n=1 Tax=Anguilla rostrata TaxID=7938 RepID=UPI0030D1A2E5
MSRNMQEQNEETPMDVDSVTPGMDGDRSNETSSAAKRNAASGNGPTTKKSPLFSGNGPSEGAITASAEARIEETSSQESLFQDLCTFEDYWVCMQAEVDWPKEIAESKQKVELQKSELENAVWHLLSKHTNKAQCIWGILENQRSIFWVKPPSAMGKLCQEQYLTIKSCNATAKVCFSPVSFAQSSPPQSPVTVQPLSVKYMDIDSMSRTSSTAKENVLTASGNSPMTNAHALLSGNGLTTNRNADFSGNGPNEGAVIAGAEAQPEVTGSQEDLYTAEGSWAYVQAEVDWPKQIAENKRKVELQKAFQSLLNKYMSADEQSQMDKVDWHLEDLENGHFAKLRVKPQSVMERLCHEQHLKFKSCDTMAKVRFSPVPSAPAAPPQSPVANRVQNEEALPRSFAAGAFEKEDRNGKFSQRESEPGNWHNSMALSTGNENSAFSQRDTQVEEETLAVPLFQYWHIATACNKEIAQIQRSNGVDIKGQALVSIMAPALEEGKSSLPRAKEEFTSLFQKCAQEIHLVTVSTTNLDQLNMMEMLKEIQREEYKLVLSVSSNGCQLSGPKESLEKFQRKWRLESRQWDSEEVLHKTFEMNLQDPLEKQGLSMDLFHWQFINMVFEKQVMAIKQKFGVDFAVEPAAGIVNVKAVPAKDQKFPLACHALRALEQLYQKGATNILACPLKNSMHSKVERIKGAFEKVCSQHPYVAAGDANGPWRLVGLAEHLRPAVEEVEHLLGEAVFSEEAKMRLQRPKSSPTASGGAAASQAGVAEDCPICMDTLRDKKKLKCTHEFCRDCLEKSMESIGPCCPVCKEVFGKIEGNQPGGKMKFKKMKSGLPGFPDCGTIEIEYHIPDGIQTRNQRGHSTRERLNSGNYRRV